MSVVDEKVIKSLEDQITKEGNLVYAKTAQFVEIADGFSEMIGRLKKVYDTPKGRLHLNKLLDVEFDTSGLKKISSDCDKIKCSHRRNWVNLGKR